MDKFDINFFGTLYKRTYSNMRISNK